MNYRKARRNMVLGQLSPCDVNNTAILDAFDTVPRECFMGDFNKAIAYSDAELNVKGRLAMAPAALGLVLQAAEPEEGLDVLYMGACGGYGPALLKEVGCIVNAVEHDESLLRMCADNLSQYDIKVSQYPLRDKYDIVVFEGCIGPDTMEEFKEFIIPSGRQVGVCSNGGLDAGYIFITTAKGGVISTARMVDIYCTQVGGFKLSRE